MKQAVRAGVLMCCGMLAATGIVLAQEPPAPQDAPQYAPPPSPPPVTPAPVAPAPVVPDTGPVPLEWTPPALAALSAQANLKDSFTLDRTLLRAAIGLLPDTDEPTRHAFDKLDGVSVHLLRFGPAGVPDEAAVDAIRESYHLRGWKHLVTTTNAGGPVHDGTTDVWMVLDGMNMRGAVILAETRRSVTLVTVAGNLSPVDLFHLRGHFGIPRFDDNGLQGQR